MDEGTDPTSDPVQGAGSDDADRTEPDGPTISVNVVLDVDADTIADELADAGLHITENHDLLGIVSGRVAQGNVDRLARVEGVAAVEPEREVEAFDPDGDASDGADPSTSGTGSGDGD